MDVTVSLNGDRQPWIEDNLQRLVVSDSAGTADDSARLTVVGEPGLLGDIPPRALIRFGVDGAQLGPVCRVRSLGWNDRTGTIDIHATAVDHDAPLREPRDADWTGQSLAAIVGRIADRSGLAPAVAPNLRAVRPDEAIQSGESDRAFLDRLADAVGGEAVVKDGHIIVLVAGEALSAGGALPLDTVEVDADSGDWRASGILTRPLFRSVVARWQAPDGEAGEEWAGSGSPVRRLPAIYASRDAAAAAARRALAIARAETIEITLTGPLRPDIRPFHPLRVLGSRLAFLPDVDLRVDDVSHNVSAFSAAGTVFRAISIPGRGRQ